MYELHRSNKFKKSFKRIIGSGTFNADVFNNIIGLLVNRQALPQKYHDHALKGNYFGLRECHIKGDCLLMYEVDDTDKVIYLIDIGNHSNLFE